MTCIGRSAEARGGRERTAAAALKRLHDGEANFRGILSAMEALPSGAVWTRLRLWLGRSHGLGILGGPCT